jgi:hypothetical protein
VKVGIGVDVVSISIGIFVAGESADALTGSSVALGNAVGPAQAVNANKPINQICFLITTTSLNKTTSHNPWTLKRLYWFLEKLFY